MTRIYKTMTLLQPEALQKVSTHMANNELSKALAISHQYLKIADIPDFHMKKAEILMKLSRPKSAMNTLQNAREKFPDDTKISEMIESIKP